MGLPDHVVVLFVIFFSFYFVDLKKSTFSLLGMFGPASYLLITICVEYLFAFSHVPLDLKRVFCRLYTVGPGCLYPFCCFVFWVELNPFALSEMSSVRELAVVNCFLSVR